MAEDAPPVATSKTRVIILTGPVGSGKTTLLNSLLCSRPTAERWAVLVNDSGKTEIEKSLTSTIEVRVVFGHCENAMNTGVPMRTALLQMLKRPRPQYLFIEMSTLGQPAALQGMLQNTFGDVVEVHTVAVVPQKTHLEFWETNPIYRAQLEQADVLAVHELDEGVADSERAGFEQCLLQVLCEKRVVFWQHGCDKELTGLSEEVASTVLLRTNSL